MGFNLVNQLSVNSPGAARRIGWSGLLAIMLVICVLAIYTIQQLAALRAGREDLEEDRLVATQLVEAFSVLKDAETSQRGFLLTGREEYLRPYETARQTLPQLMEQLKVDAVSSTSGQLGDLGRFSDLQDAKLAELASTIDLVRRGDSDRAQSIVQEDVGRQLMLQMRTLVARMTARADASLKSNAAAVAVLDRRVQWLLGSTLFGALILFFLLGRLKASIRLKEVLEQQARARSQSVAHRLARLERLSSALVPARSPLEVGGVLATEVATGLGAPRPWIAMLSEDGRWLSTVGHGGHAQEIMQGFVRVPLDDQSPVGEAITTRSPCWFESTEQVLARYPHLHPRQGPIAEAGFVAPLVVSSDEQERVIGVMTVAFEESHHFDADERRVLEAVAGQLAVALHRAALFEREQAVVRRRAELRDVASALLDALTTAEVCRILAEHARASLAANSASVELFGDAGQRQAAATVGEEVLGLADRSRMVDEALESGRPAFSGLRLPQPRDTGAVDPLDPGSALTAIVVPIIQQRRPHAAVDGPANFRNAGGVLVLEFAQPRSLLSDERVYLNDLIGHGVQAINRLDLEQARRDIDAAAAAHEWMDKVLQSLPVGVGLAQAPTGELLHLNRAVADIWGHSTHSGSIENYSKDWIGYWPGTGERYRPQDWPMARALVNGEVVDDELIEIERPDAGRRFLSLSAVPIQDDHGRITHAVTAMTDVTSRVHAERERAEDTLRLRLAMDATNMGVWEYDVESRQSDWTDRIYDLLELPEDGQGSFKRFMKRVDPEDRATLAVEVANTVRRGADLNTTFRIVSDDGNKRWLMARGQRIEDLPGIGRRVMAVVIDVTEMMRARQELEDADRLKDEFLAMLAHELRNPLAPIVNAVHILRRAGGDAETRERMITLLERQTGQLARLVDDLMEVSRIRYGRIELRCQLFPVAQAVLAAVETVQAQVESREQLLTTEIEDPSVQLNGDPVRVAQILTNLLHNASKYTHHGGRLRLSVQADVGGSEVVLRVIDEGVGLEAELLPRLFDLFAQGKRPLDRSDGGLGIGLTLVRRLAELHGGSIAASSDGAGRGATFTLRLPLPQSEIQSSEGAMHGVESVDTGTRLRVLVVDDNVDAAESLAFLLELKGHELRLAHDGGAALEQAFAFLPHIAFVDIGLPVHDGYEVARALRADERTSHVFLVAVSGYAQEEDRRRSAEAGFDLHFAKPVNFETVNGAVQAFIGSAKQLLGGTESA